MPTWLSDPPRWLYVFLILGAVLPIAAAIFQIGIPPPKRSTSKQSRGLSRRFAFILIGIIFAALFVALNICDSLYESDREQIVRSLKEVSAGVHERDLNKVFRHVSEGFRYGSTDKRNLRGIAQRAQEAGTVEEFIVWDIAIKPMDNNPNQANVQFRFKVTGPLIRENQFIGQSIWERGPEGQWQILTFQVFPATGTSDEFYIPGTTR